LQNELAKVDGIEIGRDRLKQFGIQPSMSRKGNCYDNAPMESFFGTLKNELVHHHHYRTRREAIDEIREYIEIFYNRQRRQKRLGYISPAEYKMEYHRQLKATQYMVSTIDSIHHS
jgi:transposase InsO family protein